MTGFTLGGLAGVLMIDSAVLISAGLALVMPAYLQLDYIDIGVSRELYLIGQYLLVILVAGLVGGIGLAVWRHFWLSFQQPPTSSPSSFDQIYVWVVNGLGFLTIIGDLLYLSFFRIVSGIAGLDYSSSVSFLPGASFFLATVILPITHAAVVTLVMRQHWQALRA